ncbi:hypothetical protein BV25DRAFT_1397382, partial [Artomyces pyxidatus]
MKFDALADYLRNAEDMAGMFVGPMPIDQFLEDFVPKSGEARPAAPIPFELPTQKDKYEDEFIRAMDATTLCPGLIFCNTKHTAGKEYYIDRKPDISVFRRTSQSDAPRSADEWREVELVVEVKQLDEDPFADPDTTLKSEDRKRYCFESSSTAASKARGQLISYAQAQFSCQFRTFSFSIILMGTFGRLIRWERGGAIVTELFDWTEDQDGLAEFLWRFTHLDDVERGRDDSVTKPTPDEITLARAALTLEIDSYPDGVPEILHKFRVCDDVTGQEHWFVAPLSSSHSNVLTGRATFGYVAYDLDRDICVYLKDSWRIALPEMTPEGEIYRRLHQHNVPNIADFRCAGDVQWQTGFAPKKAISHMQATVTHFYRNEHWACYSRTLIPHIHYRLSLDTIGRPLKTFKSTKQLCSAIRDAIQAHASAVTDAMVLHRDISAGNILFDKDGKGVLIDWDMSKIIDPAVADNRRQSWRTGTWQFISAARLLNPDKVHEVSDDLESFVHVLLYHLLLYRRTSFTDAVGLGQRLYQLFDEGNEIDDRKYGG